MEKIIREQIALLKELYEMRVKFSKTEHITESTKEFFKGEAEATKQQIDFLQNVLSTYNQ